MTKHDGMRQEFYTYGDEAAASAFGLLFGLIALAWQLLVVIPLALLRRNK